MRLKFLVGFFQEYRSLIMGIFAISAGYRGIWSINSIIYYPELRIESQKKGTKFNHPQSRFLMGEKAWKSNKNHNRWRVKKNVSKTSKICLWSYFLVVYILQILVLSVWISVKSISIGCSFPVRPPPPPTLPWVDTLPETNITPENRPFEKEQSYSNHPFSGAFAVSFRSG